MLFGKKCPSCTTGTRFHRVQRSFFERNLTRTNYFKYTCQSCRHHVFFHTKKTNKSIVGAKNSVI